MADDQPEIMPRPPTDHRLAAPLAGPDPAAAVLEHLRRVTALHERFLATQTIHRPPRSRSGPTLESSIEVDASACYIDGSGRMRAGSLVGEVLRLLPGHEGIVDAWIELRQELPLAGDTINATMTVSGSSFCGAIEGILSVEGDLCPEQRLPAARMYSGEAFDADAVAAFAEGRVADCFAAAQWEPARAHVRSPAVGSQKNCLLRVIEGLDRHVGVTAEGTKVSGTSPPAADLIEGAVQLAAFYLAALGETVTRDGWRFEPVRDQPAHVRWRVPIPAGPPRYSATIRQTGPGLVQADVTCAVDDVPVLHVEDLAIRLVADTPLTFWQQLGPPAAQRTNMPVPLRTLGGLRHHRETRPVARVGQVRYDYATMLASAWGRLSDVFGDWGSRGDDGIRLPGPPFMFITRVTEFTGAPGQGEVGSRLVAEYDVPRDVWYTEHSAVVPVPVLLEIALQPCEFLAGYVGSALMSDERLYIRNISGETVSGAVPSATVSLFRSTVELVSVNERDGAVIQTFEVRCEADGAFVLEGTAVFILSTAAVLDQQTGLEPPHDNGDLDGSGDTVPVDLSRRPAAFFGRAPRLSAGRQLQMLDRVTVFVPDGGRAGLGRLRAECDVDGGAWFFRAHFFTDPVQPGSLGIEAMSELLQYYVIESGFDGDFDFVPEVPGSWSFRGQVLPTDDLVTADMEILDVVLEPEGGHVEAESWLSVDGRCIYHVPVLRVRVVEGRSAKPTAVERVVGLSSEPWLADHCPTWTVPVVPLMSMVDLLAAAATDRAGRPIRILRDVQVQRWLPVAAPARIQLTSSESGSVTLGVWREAGPLSRFVPVATAVVDFGQPGRRPERFCALGAPSVHRSPYADGELFHGPSFQYLETLRTGSSGASGTLRVERGCVPHGLLQPGLLDAALHVIPHTELWRWDTTIEAGRLAFPHRVIDMMLFESLPTVGLVDVEARYVGLDPEREDLASIDVQMCVDDRVLISFRLVVMLTPTTRLAQVPGSVRRAYIRDGEATTELLLSSTQNGATVLHRADVEALDTIAGTVNAIYGLAQDRPAIDQIPEIAVKEHVARRDGVHPRHVQVAGTDDVAWDGVSARVAAG